MKKLFVEYFAVIIEGLFSMLVRQLHRRFTDIPTEILNRIEKTDNSTLLNSWLDALWEADTFADLGF